LTVAALAATVGLRKHIRVIVSEHNSLVAQYLDAPSTTLLLHATMRATFPMAHGIIGTSDGVSNEIARLAGLDRKRITTIYNPVKRPPCSDAGADGLWGDRPGKRILAMGRLKSQKNFPLLISAFAQLLHTREATLAIVGEGEERSSLEALVEKLGIEGRVLFPGLTLVPGDWYKGADLFVLSSDYEGFAIVLVEAMHFGLPVVSTDCPHGPAEVLGHGRWGRLVPVGDTEALASAMDEALGEETDQTSQRRRADEFSVERAVVEYSRIMLGGPR
jgi:glycosyltransferase involved in cell wall biosynthesis